MLAMISNLHFQLIGFLLLLSQKSGFLHSCAGGGVELVDDYPPVHLRALRVLKLSRHGPEPRLLLLLGVNLRLAQRQSPPLTKATTGSKAEQNVYVAHWSKLQRISEERREREKEQGRDALGDGEGLDPISLLERGRLNLFDFLGRLDDELVGSLGGFGDGKVGSVGIINFKSSSCQVGGESWPRSHPRC
ncbi:hypothetical protein ACFX13_008556 [Malus domestica]